MGAGRFVLTLTLWLAGVARAGRAASRCYFNGLGRSKKQKAARGRPHFIANARLA
jgi:hypothetical protein